MHAIDRRNFIISTMFLLLIVCRLENSQVKVNLSQTFLYFLLLLLLFNFFIFYFDICSARCRQTHFNCMYFMCKFGNTAFGLLSKLFSGHRSYLEYLSSSYNNKSHYNVYGMAFATFFFFSFFFLFSCKRSRDCELVFFFLDFYSIFGNFWLLPMSITYKKIIINIKSL